MSGGGVGGIMRSLGGITHRRGVADEGTRPLGGCR